MLGYKRLGEGRKGGRGGGGGEGKRGIKRGEERKKQYRYWYSVAALEYSLGRRIG